MSRPSKSVPGATVVEMTPDQVAQYTQIKTRRSVGGWGNTSSGPWGFGEENSVWLGTPKTVFDALHPRKPVDVSKNPWGY